jgi:hypothetical protein
VASIQSYALWVKPNFHLFLPASFEGIVPVTTSQSGSTKAHSVKFSAAQNNEFCPKIARDAIRRGADHRFTRSDAQMLPPSSFPNQSFYPRYARLLLFACSCASSDSTSLALWKRALHPGIRDRVEYESCSLTPTSANVRIADYPGMIGEGHAGFA